MYGPLPQYGRKEDDPPYKKIPPGYVYQFRELPPGMPIYLPEIAENRRCTDVAFIILFAIFVFILIGFSAYVFTRSEKPKPHNHNYRAESDENGEFDLKFFTITVVIMALVALVLCYLLFMSFRYNTKCTFYTLFAIEIGFFVIVAIISWAMVLFVGFLVPLIVNAVLQTIFLIAMIILIYCIRKRIPLIVAIYSEAFHAMFGVPALLFVPLLTMFSYVCANIPLFIIVLYSLNRGLSDTDLTMSLYYFVVSFVTIWSLVFIIGSQCMVVAGAVAGYYFARDKSNLGSPFCTSMCIYIRFHLGTVAAGSLIITILTMIKNYAQKAARDSDNGIAAMIIGCCLDCLIEIVEYLTKKAYIMTAIHGKSLCTSGKRAARLLWSNLLDTIAVDFVGSLALAAALFLMILITIGVGLAINYKSLQDGAKNLMFLLYILCGTYIALFIIAFFLEMLTVTIETIFLCFCEDKILNDGSRERPYYMSANLLYTMQKIFGMIDTDSYPTLPPPPGQYPGQYPGQHPSQYPGQYPSQYPNQYRR